MELEHCSSYNLRCRLRLDGGRSVTLMALDQRHTYSGLLEGVPNRRLNDGLIERAFQTAESRAARGKPHLIAPPRRDYCRQPGDLDEIAKVAELVALGLAPEFLPAVTCIARFSEVWSELVVVWFQDEFAPPISNPALTELLRLNWAKLATQFSADDL